MNPNRQITMTLKEQRQRDKRLEERAIQNALSVLGLIPLLALRDEFGFGEKRLRKYIQKYNDILDAQTKEYLTLVDIAETLEKEVNITREELGYK